MTDKNLHFPSVNYLNHSNQISNKSSWKSRIFVNEKMYISVIINQT